MKLWKRNAIAAAIVLFVCGAVYLNWSYAQDTEAGKNLGEAALVGSDSLLRTGDGDTAAQDGKDAKDTKDAKTGKDVKDGQDTAKEPGAASGTYFSTARLNRQQARDNALSLLQEAAGDEKADQNSIDEANAAIQTMAGYTVTEAQIENLVVAKGFADCVAFIGEDSLSLAVAAPEGGLTEADTAKIVDIVHQTSGFTAGQIHIIEVE